MTVALPLAAPHAGAPRATTRLARQPAWMTLLGGALLAATASSRLPTVHSSPAPAPGDRGGHPPPTRPTTPAPGTLAPLAGNEPCPHLTDYHDTLRQRCHEFLWDGIDDTGLCPLDSMLRSLWLLEQSADNMGLSNRDVHAIGQAFLHDLRPARLWEGPRSATNRAWLRQQVYVRAHCIVTALGGDAWTADQVAGSASRQSQDRREFHLHDMRRNFDRWWDSDGVDLDWFLSEYELLEPIWPAGTPLVEAYPRTEHEQGPPGDAAPHGTTARSADAQPSAPSAETAEPVLTDDGAVPEAVPHHAHTQAGHKRPRHGTAAPGAPSPTSPATLTRRPRQSSATS